MIITPKQEIMLDAELCKRSLSHFIKSAWPVIEPGYEYKTNWHIDAICEHLEAVQNGQIKRLLINIPPRHMKSIGASQAFPAWSWANTPEKRFLYLSYARDLSSKDSIKTRRLINSEFYQERFGDVFQLLPDNNQKGNFENDQTGIRFSTSMTSQLTGYGGDIVVVDDPHNVKDAIKSEQERQNVLDVWQQALPSRLNDQKNGAFVVIMQRIHESDLSGHILENEFMFESTMNEERKRKSWHHLCFPARFESDHPAPTRTSLDFKDPRTKEGELLWPDMLGEVELDEIEGKNKSGFVGQYQQRPSAKGGGILPKEAWRKWDLKDEQGNIVIPKPEYILQSYDTAFEENQEADFSACTTWYVFRDPRTGFYHALMTNTWYDKLTFPDLKKHAKDSFLKEHRRPDVILVEKKASGISLIQELTRSGLPVRRFLSDKSKNARASAASIYLTQGFVHYIDTIENNETIEQCSMFPNGKNDDLVDTVTQALIFLRNSFMLDDVESLIEDEEMTDEEFLEKNKLEKLMGESLYG